MPRLRGWLGFLILSITASGGLRSQSAAHVRPDRCFIATYRDAHGLDSLTYAATFSLKADTNWGKVESAAFFADTSNFWRMFLSNARWVQHDDRVQLQFTNGFTSVTYNMSIQGDSLVGRASINFDVKDASRPDPTIRVTGRPTSCPPRGR